ncbi:hypothetical protein DD237_005290 [Peronospora effusa]|uniref:Uncharacterized protein n=1 Tax=Peronospora effusa TaxID=542832 RepID=A0A425BZ85_9STRA|nr:hypothetical protein DD237_005290 [Peronospora effusa]
MYVCILKLLQRAFNTVSIHCGVLELPLLLQLGRSQQTNSRINLARPTPKCVAEEGVQQVVEVTKVALALEVIPSEVEQYGLETQTLDVVASSLVPAVQGLLPVESMDPHCAAYVGDE